MEIRDDNGSGEVDEQDVAPAPEEPAAEIEGGGEPSGAEEASADPEAVEAAGNGTASSLAEEPARLREEAARLHEAAVSRQAAAAELREEAARLREEATRLREQSPELLQEAARLREETRAAQAEMSLAADAEAQPEVHTDEVPVLDAEDEPRGLFRRRRRR